VEGLNTHAMRPTKNYERNVLEGGKLQMAAGTQVGAAGPLRKPPGLDTQRTWF
jgi:hypothetical protein